MWDKQTEREIKEEIREREERERESRSREADLGE
jgi:hypothetical protein